MQPQVTPTQYTSASSLSLEELARARGLSVGLLRQLGWQERPDGIAVPWPRSDGRVAWHVRCRLDGGPDGEPRWTWESYERSVLLPYGIRFTRYWVDAGHRTLVVVESEADAVACWRAGIPAVAAGGTGGWQARWWPVLRDFGRVVLWLEDSGGLQLLRALLLTRPADGPELCIAHNLPGPKDPGRILAADPERGQERVRRAVETARPVEAVEDLVQAVVERLQAKPSGQGYSARCPFHDDRAPSLSIFRGDRGWAWRCHAGSCGVGGKLEFLGAALGLVPAGWSRFDVYTLSVEPNRLREVAARDLQAQALGSGAPALTFLPFLGREGFVVRGFSHLVASAPKAGKTSLLAQVVQEWSGETVLWLTEEPEEVWRARLALLPAGALDHVTLYFALGVPGEELLDRVRKGTETVVVVDTTKVLGIGDDCDAAEVTRVLTPFIAACRDRGATLVLSHHERKGGGQHGEGIAGSHAFLALVDIALEILRDSQAPNRRLVRGYGRVLAVPELVYERREGGGLVALGDPAELTLREVQERVAALLTEDWQTLRDLVAALGEPRPSDDQVRRALNILVESGLAERDPPPGIQGNRAHRWRLRPGPGPEPDPGSGFGSTISILPSNRTQNPAPPPGGVGSLPPHGGPSGFGSTVSSNPSNPNRAPAPSVGGLVGSGSTDKVYRSNRTQSDDTGQGESSGPPEAGRLEKTRVPSGFGSTDKVYRSNRTGPGTTLTPTPEVDLLEGTDLLATLSEEDAPDEEPGQPPDLGLLPPGPGADLGPVGEDQEPPKWALDLAEALPGTKDPVRVARAMADLLEPPVDPDTLPLDARAPACPCCGGRRWWQRPRSHGGGWVCARCHPPLGVEPAAWQGPECPPLGPPVDPTPAEDQEAVRARRRKQGLCEGCGGPVAVLGGKRVCSRCGWKGSVLDQQAQVVVS